MGGHPAQLIIREPNQPRAELLQLAPAGTAAILTAKPQALVPTRYFPSGTPALAKPIPTAIYMQRLLSSKKPNSLVHVANDASLNGFRYHLQQYCINTKRPFFYIHSPEDLICSAPYIQRDGTTGVIKEGPGGPLHDFLKAHTTSDPAPVLIVNYDRFSASDMVRFNTLLDKERFADGSPIPEKAQVIGLMNPGKPGAYNGADFRSRFDAILTNPLSEKQLPVPEIPKQQGPLSEQSQSINLYGGNDWEDRLLGHWVLMGEKLHFVEGELLLALKNKNTPIELKNAPWANAAFQAFWQEALLRQSVLVQGVRYDFPQDFTLSQAEGYSFEKTITHIKINESNTIPADALVLNRGLLARFFGQYLCDNKNKTIK